MRWFRDLSISTKLTTVSVLGSAVALILAGAGFLAYDLVTFRDSLARRMTTQADMVGTNSRAALLFEDEEAARRTLESLQAEPNVLEAILYTRSGTAFARYAGRESVTSSLPERLPKFPQYGHRFEPDRLVVLRPVVLDEERIGSVLLRGEVEEIRARSLRYLGIAGVVLLLSLGVGYLISTWPRRAIHRSILSLVSAAERVSRQRDYGVRAQKHGDDELGRLVDTFNEMLGDIERGNRELLEARDQALEASRLKSAFLANMSHEIRTPLNVILGYNNMIAEELEERGHEGQGALLDAIRRASRRLIETIDGILDISRIESKTFEVKPVPLDLAAVVGQQVRELVPLATQKGLALDLHVETGPVKVLCDEYCLSHALMNLIQNGIKFTARGGVEVCVERDDEGRLQVRIRDTGIGIDASYLPNLFQPFSQEDTGYTRKFEGSGLGLALTRRYLELNEATVSAESTKGKGSVFTIRFPREREVEAGAPAGPQRRTLVEAGSASDRIGPSSPEEPATADERPGVLLVEDHDDTRGYVRAILDGRFRVFEAASGEEVRRQLDRHGGKIRLILMDLSLRGESDGLALTRELRRDPRWASVPIIATTAHAFAEDQTRALAAGCDRFLAKPIHHRTLLAVMTACLEARTASRRAAG